MINELVYFVKTHFRRSRNGLMQVILLNALSFLVLLLLKVVLVIAGYKSAYIALCQSLVLPASWSTYVKQPWALLTHFWIHVSFFSVFWGLLLLYSLGLVVVRRLGSRHFVALYLLGGLAGGVLFLLLYNVAPHFQGANTSILGFAGSLYAVMIAAATLSPQLSFSLFFLPFLKFKHVAGFLVLVALVDLVGNEPAMSAAQLGGALLGYVYIRCYQQSATWWRRSWMRFKRPDLRVSYRSAIPWSAKAPEASTDKANLDHILDKVAASGYESLTPAEKQQLFNAGK
ncbi:MAG: rhomboid family intramembrane serine protease [Bacteroidota bacterium]